MLTIILSAVCIALVVGHALLWVYVTKLQETLFTEIVSRGKAASDALVAEVQVIVDAMAKDTEDKLEEMAQQQSKAITALLNGQDVVNKDYKARIEALMRQVDLHGKVLKFDTDGITGASIMTMQQHAE